MRLVDVHVHLHEFKDPELAELLGGRIVDRLVAVSDDEGSSLKTLELAAESGVVIPCVGVHPWSVSSRSSIEEARRVVDLALEKGVRCIGEVGLDTKFVAETIELQREVFKVFLEAARDHGLFLNLHTAGTWQEVYQLLVRYDVAAANFHWYTGPPSLLKDIESSGYTVSINPAIKLQRKHQEVVKVAPLSMLLTESDGPYRYKGVRLWPGLVKETLQVIAELKEMDVEEVSKAVWNNFEKKVLARVGAKRSPASP